MPPNQGARVVEWSDQDLSEITDLRAVLESFGTGLAAQRISHENLNRRDHLCDEMEQAVSRGTQADLDGAALNKQLKELNVRRRPIADLHLPIAISMHISESGNTEAVQNASSIKQRASSIPEGMRR